MIAPQHEQKIVSCHDGDGIREVAADREKLEGWLKTLGGPADLMAALDDRIGPSELRRRVAGQYFTRAPVKRLACIPLTPRWSVLCLSHTEEPEMWEGCAEWARGSGQGEVAVPPSISATVALNLFLWEHSGGWVNTFG